MFRIITGQHGICLQIHSSQQCATGMVHMYPFLLHKDRLFAILAAQEGEPSMHDLLNGTAKRDSERMTSDWQHVVDYLSKLKLSKLSTYQPLDLQKMSEKDLA